MGACQSTKVFGTDTAVSWMAPCSAHSDVVVVVVVGDTRRVAATKNAETPLDAMAIHISTTTTCREAFIVIMYYICLLKDRMIR